jgi:mono/diheme cytochrome c family protein
MKSSQALFCGMAGVFFAGAGLFAADVKSTNETVTSPPVYVPDTSHANEPLPDGVIAWDALLKSTEATNGQDFAHFTFSFTNITAGNVTVLDVHPGCGCTTVDLPPRPWTIAAGASGQMNINVNLAGKTSMPGVLPKYVNVSTDKGSKQLNLVINVLPAPPMVMSEEDRAKGLAAAKIDRQAVFKGDCAACHIKSGEGKYGNALFDAVCAVCHETNPRATMVPDLHNLTVPTNDEFWRTWITHGKPGSLMPAFSTAEGGPLNDMQIASLAAYLNYAIPSHVVTLMTTNAPPSK